MSPIADIVSKIEAKATHVAGLEELQAAIGSNVKAIEPYVVAILPKVIDIAGEKPKAPKVREVLEAFIDAATPYGVVAIMPSLIAGVGVKAKPTTKEVCLAMITKIGKQYPEQAGRELVHLIGPLSDLMNDVKKEVKNGAGEAMEAVCACTGNRDLEPFIPFVIEAIKDITKADKCVEKLASCVFVQNVEAPALAVTIPVLQRGLRDRNEELKRTCCVIIDNMCKLVEDPKEVLPLMPRLEPLVKTASEAIGDPEARGVAERAYKTLSKASGEGNAVGADVTIAGCTAIVKKAKAGVSDEVANYLGAVLCSLGALRHFDAAVWEKNVKPLLDLNIASTIVDVQKLCADEEEEDEDDGEGKELYKGAFSLAYGTLTLLRDAKMNLKWNKFYGLLGPNNCGKTTLMRAIGNEQLEGFPTRKELLSVFVEHEIEEREVGVQDDGFPIMNIDLSGIDWVVDTVNNVYKVPNQTNADDVRKMMTELGFGKDRAADADMGVTTYSGGWKMKMQLCAAALMNADVLMLDEPTGHLDVDNQAWLRKWLQEFPGTIICTSHDSAFLDVMCDAIIDFADRKLKTFRGSKGKCLTEFVEKYPEKQGYFELKNDVQKFVFPVPGPLEGIKSRTKNILKMQDVVFQYPTRDIPTIFDINLNVTQVSRVAVIGANGAGKSTAIKVLVGELVPKTGTVWKAPGMRMAYVAQHAFHHVENHLDKTPAQYIMWRFAGNDDRESLEFKGDEISTSEEELRAVKWMIDPVRLSCRKVENEKEERLTVVPEAIMLRRVNKKEKTKEYEVKWQFKDITDTHWVNRETLIMMGYIKFVQREDEKQAAMAGLQTKHLTSKGVEEHLTNYGLEAETSSHTMIRHLSGGQKVKVVIAAAMWQNPHMLILDEPTNYLDRDGLGALTLAIRDYQGGVLIISHNREFCDGCCQEKWIMQAGRLRIEGSSYDPTADKDDGGNAVQEDVLDAAGNKVDVKLQVTLSDKDKKKQLKLLEKKLKDNKKTNTLTEDEVWEVEDQITALKE